MNQNPIDPNDRRQIADLQKQLDTLRARLHVNERGRILYRSDSSCSDDKVILVEADGLGGAVLRVVEGNYPIDYFIRKERIFSTEAEAETTAESLAA